MGARWVQTQILAQYPSAQLRVYAVWLPMLGGDRREAWNGTNMPDSRVIHFWDGDLELGQWFAKEVGGYEGLRGMFIIFMVQMRYGKLSLHPF